MNFLKRAGAILMVVAIFASSCNKYADDFEQVNKKLDALATSVAGISQIQTDVTAMKSQITALQTAVAALPTATQQTAQFAAVGTQLTAMTTAIAAIDTQVKAIAATGTATKAAVDKLATDLAALSKKVSDDNAKILAGQADAAKALAALDTKVTGLDTKMTDMAKTMADLSAAVAKVQAGTDANTAGIAGLATQLTAQATEIAKIAADQKMYGDANAAAITADAAANASLMAANADILAKIAALQTEQALAAKTGTDTDTATALTIKGLQLMLDAQKKQLDLIVSNTALKVTDVTITGTLNVGGILTANTVPATATVTYQWSTATSATGTYTDIAGATANKYTILAGDLNNFFKVKVVGTNSYANSNATSIATATAVGAQIAMVSVGTPVVNTSGDPFPQVGKKIKAGTLNPSDATVNWQWQSSSASTGVYTDIAGATAKEYTPVMSDANMYLRVIATGKEAFTGVVTSGAAGPFLAAAVTTPNFSAVAGNNLVTITLTDGTFKAAPIGATDFTWKGVDATSFETAVYTRVSNTVVTAQLGGSTSMTVGGLNNVTVLSGTLATASTGVTGVASTAIAVNAPIAATFTTTVAGDNTIVVALGTATFRSGTFTSADFTISGTDAAVINAGAFIRTNSTTVTIRTNTLMAGGTDHKLTINSGALATSSGTATGTSSFVAAPNTVSPDFTMVAANNAVSIKLTGGTFATGIAKTDLTWAGADAAIFSAAATTLTYIDATTVILTGANITALVGTNNQVTVAGTGILAYPSGLTLAVTGVTKSNLVAANFNTTITQDKLEINLNSGGLFRTGAPVAADFDYAGNAANAALFAAATFARTSDTKVTVTVAGGGKWNAGINTITVLPSAYAVGTSASVSPKP